MNPAAGGRRFRFGPWNFPRPEIPCSPALYARRGDMALFPRGINQSMSDEIEDTPAVPAEAPAAKVAKKRPAVRKSSKAPAKAAAESEAPPQESRAEAEAAPAPARAEAPAAERAPARERERDREAESASSESSSAERGPDPSDGGRIAFLMETPAGEPGGGSKKRRRRKKKKHDGPQQGHPQQHQHPHAVSAPSEAPAGERERDRDRDKDRERDRERERERPPVGNGGEHAAQAMHAAPRPKLDPEQVAKKAWKIYQAEVSEEGLALIDDQDAREISRRCFRLAEIFLEEASRRASR